MSDKQTAEEYLEGYIKANHLDHDQAMLLRECLYEAKKEEQERARESLVPIWVKMECSCLEDDRVGAGKPMSDCPTCLLELYVQELRR